MPTTDQFRATVSSLYPDNFTGEIDAADVTIAFGSQSILCKSTTVAFVQNCMVA